MEYESTSAQPSLSAAMNELAAIEGRIRQGRSADSEPDALNAIRAELVAEKITPAQALERGRGLEHS